MNSLRRLRGILAAATVVAACLATCEAALAMTAPWWPWWLKNDWAAVEFMNYPQLGGQIAGISGRTPDPSEPIGVLLGSSYQAFDIDVAAMESGVRPRRRWLRLTCYAGSTCELDRIAEMLMVRARIRPATVVITLGLKMLSRSDSYRKFDTTDLVASVPTSLVSHLRALRLLDVERDFESLVANGFNSVFPDRIKINYRLRSRLLGARLALLEGCHQEFVRAFTPSPSPWVEIPPELRRAGPEGIKKGMRQEREEGKFDPQLYSPDNEACRSLMHLVRVAQSVGSEPIIVIMPEPSFIREAVPPEARRAFLTALGESFGTSGPRVVDLEAFSTDERFLDLHHLDEQGRSDLTRRLVAELNIEGSAARTTASPGGSTARPGPG